MKKISIVLSIAMLISTTLHAIDLQSVKVTIKLVDGKEYTGYVTEQFPEKFNYNNKSLTKYFKNLNRNQIFIVNEVIIETNGFLLRFIEQSSPKLLDPKQIDKVHYISKYSKPVPNSASIVSKEEFNVLSKKLCSAYYLSPDKISKDIKTGFLFLSFDSTIDLEVYINRALGEIKNEKQFNNLILNKLSVRKTLLNYNVYLYFTHI